MRRALSFAFTAAMTFAMSSCVGHPASAGYIAVDLSLYANAWILNVP